VWPWQLQAVEGQNQGMFNEVCSPFLTFTLERSRVRILAPLFLFETRAALLALNAASVVLARTCKQASLRSWIQKRTGVGVTIAHASASNGNVFNRVKVTASYSWILTSDAHQMTQQVLGS
jgi:hypothetical protein